MDIKKELKVKKFESKWVRNVPYKVELMDREFESELMFDKPALRRNGLLLEDLMPGKKINVILKSGRVGSKGGTVHSNIDCSCLKIENILMQEEQKRRYMSMPPRRRDSLVYSVLLRSFGGGDGIHPTPIPSPFYKINLGISKEEYDSLKKLPGSAIMRVSFEPIDGSG